jgi:hypothetical protein
VCVYNKLEQSPQVEGKVRVARSPDQAVEPQLDEKGQRRAR